MRTIVSILVRAMETSVVALALIGGAALPSAPAYAYGAHGGGWHGGGYWHGGGHTWHGGGWGWPGWGWGPTVYWGWPGFYDDYDYPYYYLPAVPSTTVIAPAPTVAPAPSPAFWYYCENPRGYYPYVASCRQTWRAVPAVPPGNKPR